MDHVVKNHLPKNALPGKSYFYTNDVGRVSTLINQVLTSPDKVEKHRWDARKTFLKKSFHFAIGVHGFTGRSCFTITLVFNNATNMITAFPTL